MDRSLEKTLAFHCAPALVGLKAADLISCNIQDYPELEKDIAFLNQKLNPNGLFFRPLGKRNGRILLLTYRRAVLERYLQDKKIRAFLLEAGYPASDLEGILLHLQERLAQMESFPHETGVILGYPLEDVKGFLKHRGQNCKLCGYWKVYSNEPRALDMFRQFNHCRDTLCSFVASGMSITQMFHAA